MAFLILFEPEIAHNVGALVRTSVCFGSKLVIIRPTGFVWDQSLLRRSAMDYFEAANIEFFDCFDEFKEAHDGRIIGTSIGFGHDYSKFEFRSNDAIVLGRESTGLPKELYDKFDDSITIPIQSRSLNLSTAGAVIISRANSIK